MADLHAKEGSQETIVGLVGMIFGSVFLHVIPAENFLFFTILHLLCNYRGIRAVVMPTLNTQRSFLIIREYLDTFNNDNKSTHILTPREVANLEHIFWAKNYYSANGKRKKINIQMGVSLDAVVESWAEGVGSGALE
ncbi:hypothetical protein HK100_005047 [Physocladia obscura]|uniref:Protein root UVB sensitive/RUS domain-containing protein n=1 Tax=Physocladia obscura TaxID=109957 RepID=A0AAD5TAK6_9FUNG|nr:hypothetical protein HK100_005047 [Physocladia obscura]